MISKLFQYFYSRSMVYQEKGIIRNFIRGQKPCGTLEQDVIYQEIQTLWNDLDLLKDIEFPAREMARARWNNAPYHRTAGQHTWLRACAVACCLMIIAAVWHIDPWPLQESVYETFDGKSAELSLADGSLIYMNTGSRLKVSLYRSRREVVFDMGEAFFEVYPDSDKPFTVIAGSSHVRAVGTAFNVYKKADQIKVAVAEGVVAVSTANDSEKILLQQGKSIHYDNNAVLAFDTVPVDTIASWRKGSIIFQEMPLSEVLQELKRYGLNKPVSLSEDIAQLKLSGSFRVNNPEKLLWALPDALSIEIIEHNDHISIVSRH